ncbi:MAG: hypothetical protein AMXMBFR64_26750 [Myxococcales bacterium]
MSRGPRRPFALWGTVLVLLLSVTATARPMLQRERIVDALTRPISETSKADWLGMGPPLTTNKLLVDLATGKGVPRIYQLRALEVLPFFPTKQSMQVLWEVVYDRDTDDVRRKVALRSLGAGWQSEVLHDLISFLDEQSETLREGAVMGIGLIDDPRVTTLLENRLYREETIRVRLAIEKALQQSRQYDMARDRRDAENIFEQPVRVFPPGFSPTLPKEPSKGRADQPQR